MANELVIKQLKHFELVNFLVDKTTTKKAFCGVKIFK